MAAWRLGTQERGLSLLCAVAVALGIPLALFPPGAVVAAVAVVAVVLSLRASRRLLLLSGAAVVLGLLLAVWTGVAVAAAAVGLVTVLALRAPAFGFVVALALVGFEGTLKEKLTFDGSPLSVSGAALGAGVLDLCVLIAVAGLLLHDRSSLRDTWRGSGRAVRAGALMLGAWLVLGVVQIPQGGHLVQGVDGFRLIHWYAVAAVAGVVLVRSDRRALDALLVLLLVVTGYAALRAIIGPSADERAFALSRQGVTQYGSVFRDVGSFSGAVGLASFAALAGVFAFVVAVLSPRLRLVGIAVSACALVAVIATYARVAVVAMVIAVIAAGALAYGAERLSRRQKLLAAAAVLVAVGLGVGGTILASRSSPELRARAHVFIHPLADQSVHLRLDNWRRSLHEVLHHPLGSGVGSVGRASSLSGDPTVTTDNTYLEILREQGFLGGGLFLFGILVTIGGLAAGVRHVPDHRRPAAIAAVAAAVAFVVLAAAGEYFEQPGKVLFWAFLGLGAGAVALPPTARELGGE